MLIKPFGREIGIGFAGSVDTDTGQRTTTLAAQVQTIPEMFVSAVYNPDMKEAELVAEKSGLSELLRSGSLTAVDSLEAFLSAPMELVIVSDMDAAVANEVILASFDARKHVVNLNAVSEAALGVFYKRKAAEAGVIYSVGAGDEPAATLELVEFCEKLNLDVVCAGKGKNNPMNLHAVPDDYFKYGKEKNLNPQSIASFVDGTKTMLEMSILSNATGWSIDKPGMHGPKVDVDELHTTFVPESAGGILSGTPVIDYGIGNIAPGVFVIFTTGQQSIIDELLYLKMQGGPYFHLYKPYHLGNIEAPLSIHSILRDKRPSLVIKEDFVTMVCAKAKKDLKTGDLIDTSGGYSFYGYAVPAEQAAAQNLAPLALVEKSRVNRDIGADELITMDDILIDQNRGLLSCWEEQQGFM